MQNDFDPLFEFLREGIFANAAIDQDAAQQDHELRPLVGADKYLLASLLQKAIRRGDLAIADTAARALLSIDKARLWRRLMVTALEDIGLGDVDVAVLMAVAATSANWRKRLGGDAHILERLLPLACSATKERSADHISSIVRHEPAAELEYCALKGASLAALLAIIAMPSLPLLYRVRAALIAGGRYSARDSLRCDVRDDQASVFGTFHELEVPPLLVETCRIYARRSDDPLAFIVPCLWSLWQSEGASRDVVRHELPPAEMVRGIPLYALDPLHTRLGREAIKHWLRGLGSHCRWEPRQVAIALWNFESAACDRTLSWKSAETLRCHGHRVDLLARNVPVDQHDALKAFIAREYPSLGPIRRTLLCAVNSSLGASAPALPPIASLIQPQEPSLRKEPILMPSKDFVRLEAGRYRLLAEKLKSDFVAIDDETLADTLEGLSDLPEIVEVILRSSLEDECLIEALKLRLETMNARLSRFKERFEKKRELACFAMGSAGINKIELVDFSVSFSEGNPKAEIHDAGKIPQTYLIPAAPKIDRANLLIALKRGEIVEGASLMKGEAYISVRTR